MERSSAFAVHPNVAVVLSEPEAHVSIDVPSLTITHNLGHFLRPMTTCRRDTVYFARYTERQKPFAGPVEKLQFLHVGSQYPPNVEPYSGTCTTLDFMGHLGSTNSVFGVVSQLPKLKNVNIFIRPQQQQYFPEAHNKFPKCPSVKHLKIIMDVKYYNSYQHATCDKVNRTPQCAAGICTNDVQTSFLFLVESLLKHAKESFSNLQSLGLELPESRWIRKRVNSLIKSKEELRTATPAEAGAQLDPSFDNVEINPACMMTFYVGENPETEARVHAANQAREDRRMGIFDS